MDHLMREFLGYFWRLTAEEIIASELAHETGYLSVPSPSRGWLEMYYGTCCVFEQKPAVILTPERGKKRKLGVSLPTTEALPQIVQLAADAGCQGRREIRPLRRSKTRPVGGVVAVFVGRLERSLRAPFRATQA